jgi:hypothetical protein
MPKRCLLLSSPKGASSLGKKIGGHWRFRKETIDRWLGLFGGKDVKTGGGDSYTAPLRTRDREAQIRKQPVLPTVLVVGPEGRGKTIGPEWRRRNKRSSRSAASIWRTTRRRNPSCSGRCPPRPPERFRNSPCATALGLCSLNAESPSACVRSPRELAAQRGKKGAKNPEQY